MPLTPPAERPLGYPDWAADEYAWALGMARAILAAHDKLEPAVEALLAVEPLGDKPLPMALLAPVLPSPES